nr:MAG TPA: hypothetical protein [Caudoviricetes sp.]
MILSKIRQDTGVFHHKNCAYLSFFNILSHN